MQIFDLATHMYTSRSAVCLFLSGSRWLGNRHTFLMHTSSTTLKLRAKRLKNLNIYKSHMKLKIYIRLILSVQNYCHHKNLLWIVFFTYVTSRYSHLSYSYYANKWLYFLINWTQFFLKKHVFEDDFGKNFFYEKTLNYSKPSQNFIRILTLLSI